MNWFTKKTPVVVTQERGPAVEVEQVGWISVKDKVPEFGVRVLVYCTHYGAITGNRVTEDSSGTEWRLGIRDVSPYAMYYTEARSKTVTHWMPTPPGPQS